MLNIHIIGHLSLYKHNYLNYFCIYVQDRNQTGRTILHCPRKGFQIFQPLSPNNPWKTPLMYQCGKKETMKEDVQKHIQ